MKPLNFKFLLTWDILPGDPGNNGGVAATKLDIQSDSEEAIKAVTAGLIATGVTSISLHEWNGKEFQETPLHYALT